PLPYLQIRWTWFVKSPIYRFALAGSLRARSDKSGRRIPKETGVASIADLQARAKVIRRDIITSTTAAGSGHPTSSLSGVEIAVALYFGGVLRYDPKNPAW